MKTQGLHFGVLSAALTLDAAGGVTSATCRRLPKSFAKADLIPS